jgi:hypothetical protein
VPADGGRYDAWVILGPRARGLLLAVSCLLGCDPRGSGAGTSTPGGSTDAPGKQGPSSGRGTADAERDLAQGKAGIETASGIARYPLTPDVDPETGLPFHDTGCVVDQPYQDAYNGAVRRWVAAHGLPANSLKARILDDRVIDELLGKGMDLATGPAIVAPDGRRAEMRGNQLHLEGGPFAHPYELPVGGPGNHLRIAWAPAGQVLLRVTGPRDERFSGNMRAQIDPGCGCLVRVLR